MPIVRTILFVVAITVAEFYVTVYKVPQLIGAGWTIALLAASSLVGIWLLKQQGRAAWQRFGAALSEGRPPHREVLDGVLVIFGGACLILPGFVTDAFGLFLLLPPTRPIARRIVQRRLTRGALGAAARTAAGRRRTRPTDFDVEGTATDVPPEERVGERPDRQLRR